MSIRPILGIAGVAVMTGCTEYQPPFDPPTRDDAPVQTDAVEYTLERYDGVGPYNSLAGYYGQARAIYVNTGSTDVHYARCFHEATTPMYRLRKAAPDDGASGIIVAWGCPGGVPSGIIPPGGTVEIDIPLDSFDNGDASIEERTGLFRVELELIREPVEESSLGQLRPLDERQSNAFLVLPPG